MLVVKKPKFTRQRKYFDFSKTVIFLLYLSCLFWSSLIIVIVADTNGNNNKSKIKSLSIEY